MKRPEIWPEPPVIGDWMRGAEITLLSSTMASGRPTILRRRLAEALGAADVEAEVDDRLVGAAVEGGLGVDEIAALDDDAALDRHALAALRPATAACRRRPRPAAPSRRNSSFAVSPRMLLEALRVLQARHLDEDAVGALALDVRLGRAERVDAAADDLDGLVDGAADALVDAGFRIGELDQAVRRARRSSMSRSPRLAEDRRCRSAATAPAASAAAGRARPRPARGAGRRAERVWMPPWDDDAGLAQDAADVVAQLRRSGCASGPARRPRAGRASRPAGRGRARWRGRHEPGRNPARQRRSDTPRAARGSSGSEPRAAGR